MPNQSKTQKLQRLFNELCGTKEDVRQQQPFWGILHTGIIPMSHESFFRLLDCSDSKGGKCIRAESICPAIQTLLTLAYFSFLARTQAPDDDPTHCRIRAELEGLASVRVNTRTIDIARSCHDLLHDHYCESDAGRKLLHLNRHLINTGCGAQR